MSRCLDVSMSRILYLSLFTGVICCMMLRRRVWTILYLVVVCSCEFPALLERCLLACLVQRGLDALLHQRSVHTLGVRIPLLRALVLDRLTLQKLLHVPLIETVVVLLLQLSALRCKTLRHHVTHPLYLVPLYNFC